jgi:hypothetical protein
VLEVGGLAYVLKIESESEHSGEEDEVDGLAKGGRLVSGRSASDESTKGGVACREASDQTAEEHAGAGRGALTGLFKRSLRSAEDCPVSLGIQARLREVMLRGVTIQIRN